MSEICCPYCSHFQEVCNVDGFGTEYDETYEFQCRKCEKHFVFTSEIRFDYSPNQADCLNGGEHTYFPTHTYPKECTRMECSQCYAERQPTTEEMAEIMADEA